MLSGLGEQVLAEAAGHGGQQRRAAILREQAANTLPEYGSEAWQALPDGDARKVAAVARAAECWRTLMATPHGQELLDELDAWHIRRTLSEWSSAVSAMVHSHIPGPSHAELQRRRAVAGPMAAEFAERHGGEYRGGPVDWATGRPVGAP